MRLKYLAKHVDERFVTTEMDLMSVSKTKGVIPRSEISDAESRAEDISHYKTCQPGDMVINRMSAYQGALGIAKQSGAVSPDYMVLRFGPKFAPEFAGYFFKSHQTISLMSSLVKGIGSVDSGSVRTPRLSWTDLGNSSVSIPSVADQIAIAEFLDRETSQIDELIHKQKQLVETLSERRKAVITRAVTRGLDHTAELSDLGHAFVAQTPKHWAVIPLRYVVKTIDSGVSVNAADTPAPWGEVGVLKTSCVYTGEFNPNENKTVNSDEIALVSCPVVKDRLIVSRMNTPSLVGAAGLVRSEVPNLFLPDRLWQVEVTCNTAFLHYWMQTPVYRDQVSLLAVGTSSSMQNLSQGAFRSVTTVLPPSHEQAEIVSFIGENVSKIDLLIGKALQVINVLKERRQALISVAVTGKIDFRGN